VRELGNEWRSLAASVPQSVTAVQNPYRRVDKGQRAPKDVDLAAAKSGLADATSAWRTAQSNSNRWCQDAVAAAKDASGKLASAAGALKLSCLTPASES